MLNNQIVDDKWYTKAVPLFFFQLDIGTVGVVVHHVKSDAETDSTAAIGQKRTSI